MANTQILNNQIQTDWVKGATNADVLEIDSFYGDGTWENRDGGGIKVIGAQSSDFSQIQSSGLTVKNDVGYTNTVGAYNANLYKITNHLMSSSEVRTDSLVVPKNDSMGHIDKIAYGPDVGRYGNNYFKYADNSTIYPGYIYINIPSSFSSSVWSTNDGPQLVSGTAGVPGAVYMTFWHEDEYGYPGEPGYSGLYYYFALVGANTSSFSKAGTYLFFPPYTVMKFGSSRHSGEASPVSLDYYGFFDTNGEIDKPFEGWDGENGFFAFFYYFGQGPYFN